MWSEMFVVKVGWRSKEKKQSTNKQKRSEARRQEISNSSRNHMIARRESDAMTKWLREASQRKTFAQLTTSGPGCAPEAIRGDAITAQPPMLINNLWWALAAEEKMFPVPRPFRTREGKPRWCSRRNSKHGKATCHHIIVSHGRERFFMFLQWLFGSSTTVRNVLMQRERTPKHNWFIGKVTSLSRSISPVERQSSSDRS